MRTTVPRFTQMQNGFKILLHSLRCSANISAGHTIQRHLRYLSNTISNFGVSIIKERVVVSSDFTFLVHSQHMEYSVALARTYLRLMFSLFLGHHEVALSAHSPCLQSGRLSST